MKPYLETQIRQRQEQLREIEKTRTTVQAELRAFEEMLQHWISENDGSEPEKPTEADNGSSHPPGGFEMSKEWLNVMATLSARGRSFNAGDMVRVGQEAGYSTKMANARSQIAFYGKRGYIKRIRRGQYTIAAKGQEAFKKQTPAGEAGVSKVAGEVRASSVGKD